MDQFNPKDNRAELRGVESAPPPKPPTIAGQFYKEFVQFAVFLGVTLFPIYLSFDAVTEELRFLVAQYVEPVSRLDDKPARYQINKTFTQVSLVGIYCLLFTSIFFARQALKHRYQRAAKPQDVTIIDKSLIQEKNKKIDHLQYLRRKDMEILRTIHKDLYSEGKPRLDLKAEKGRYYVTSDGTLKVHKEIIVKADEKEGFLWTFNAFGDPESRPVEVDEMHIRIMAEDKNTDLLYLPIRDETLRKEFVIYFLPLLKPGESRTFTLSYEWPGSFSKLLTMGWASYSWKNRTTSAAHGEFYAEWRFDEKLGAVDGRNTGDAVQGIELKRQVPDVPTRWIFSGDCVPLNNVHYEITFWTGSKQPNE